MNNENNSPPDLNDVPLNEESGLKINPTMSPVKAAVFGLIAVFFLYQVGSALIILLIFGADLTNIDNNSIRLITTGSQILFILLPALLFSKLVYEDVTKIIRFKIPDLREILIFLFGLIIVIPLLQNFLYIQNYIIEQLAKSSSFVYQVKYFLDQIDKWIEEAFGNLLFATNWIEGIFIVLVVALVPGVCEEVFFRGFVQKSFEFRFKPYWAIFITALFFGFYHFNPYGLIALVFLGIYLGFAAYKSNSIFVPMILHFFNNFVAIMIYFLFDEEEFINPGAIGAESIGTYIFSFGGLLFIFIIFIYFVFQFYKKFNNTEGGNHDLSTL